MIAKFETHAISSTQRAGEIADELVALSVDRRVDVVHDLAREAGHSHARIEARGAQPQDTATRIGLADPPEADVVLTARALSDSLLERKVLRPPWRDEVRAHRSGRVSPVEENALRVAQSALPGDAIGQGPAGGAHRDRDVAPGSDDRHVDRVRRDSLDGVSQPGKHKVLGKLCLASPDRRQHTVRNACVRG